MLPITLFLLKLGNLENEKLAISKFLACFHNFMPKVCSKSGDWTQMPLKCAKCLNQIQNLCNIFSDQ